MNRLSRRLVRQGLRTGVQPLDTRPSVDLLNQLRSRLQGVGGEALAVLAMSYEENSMGALVGVLREPATAAAIYEVSKLRLEALARQINSQKGTVGPLQIGVAEIAPGILRCVEENREELLGILLSGGRELLTSRLRALDTMGA